MEYVETLEDKYRMIVTFENSEDMFIEEDIGNIGFMSMRAKLQDIILSVMESNNTDKISVIVLYEICHNLYTDDYEYFDSDVFDVTREEEDLYE